MRQKFALLGLGVFVSLCVCLFKSDYPVHCGCADASPEAAAPGRACEAESAGQSTTYNFARIALRVARGLEGKRVTAQVQTTSEPIAADNGTTLYHCRSADQLVRSVCFGKVRAPDPAKADSEMIVEGQLEIRFHNSWTVDGQTIPSYFELRLVDAEIVKH